MLCLLGEEVKIRFNESGEIIEIIVRDFSGAKIESYKFRIKDKDKMRKTFKMLKQKYDLGDFIITKKKIKDRDIDWLKNPEWD